MQTYEFNTILKNGMILVPEKMKNEINGKVRVVISKKDKTNTEELVMNIKNLYKKYNNIQFLKNVNPMAWQKKNRRKWERS